jgi:Helix-turn-helix of DDE superfamily endonuclease
MISASEAEWVPVFTGLSVRQFGRLVGIVRRRGAEQTGAGRRWGLSLPDRVLLVAVYYRTNLTLRQIALLFWISKSRHPHSEHGGPWPCSLSFRQIGTRSGRSVPRGHDARTQIARP